jgi:hypothetical protein
MLRMTELKKDDTRNILSDIKLFEGLTQTGLGIEARASAHLHGGNECNDR